MKREDIVKQLTPGVVVGFVLGFILVMIVGVDEENLIPNFIGGAMCCLVPTLLNCLIVLKGTAKTLKRDLPISKALVRIIPYVISGGLIGIIVVAGIINNIMGIDVRTIPVLITAIYEAILGVVVSTVCAYLALKSYEKDVKYTRRTKKEK